MKISSINTNAANFGGGFYVTDQGAYELAKEFVEKPELEEQFMDNIVKPLKNSNGFVLYNGYSTDFKCADGLKSCVLRGTNWYNSSEPPYILGLIVQDYSRNVYYRHSDLIPTKIFANAGILNKIEAAKNIVMDREYLMDKQAIKVYSKAHENESVEEKAERFREVFKPDEEIQKHFTF